jgi:polyribonucleotide nucleotidyltransferase
MAYAYQVTTSDDGTIGIFANRQRAIEKAIEYVTQCSESYDRTDNKWGDVYISGERIYAEVERWVLG